MLLLTTNQIVSTQLDDIKWFVEVLVGITVGLIFATGIATWKVSDIEVKNIKKYLENNIDENYKRINSNLTIKEEQFKPVSINGWILKKGTIKELSFSNITIITLDVELINQAETILPMMFMSEPFSQKYDLNGEYPCFVLDQSSWITVENSNGSWKFKIKDNKESKTIRIQQTWINPKLNKN